MRYAPNKIKESDQIWWKFTGGMEYKLPLGQPYYGYFNVTNNIAYTGITFSIYSEPLTPYVADTNENTQYKNMSNFPIAITSPILTIVNPTSRDYSNGKFVRYFAKRSNDDGITSIIEIDNNQFSQNKTRSLYRMIQLDWKITGSLYDVYNNGMIIKHGIYDTNKRTLEIKEKEFVGISKVITNLTQFARVQ